MLHSAATAVLVMSLCNYIAHVCRNTPYIITCDSSTNLTDVCTHKTLSLSFAVCRTILLSVISLLNEPNTFSAANVDASVLYRKWRDSRGKDKQYIEVIK